jgi:putative ATP-dependent endonuclease of OLD family
VTPSARDERVNDLIVEVEKSGTSKGQLPLFFLHSLSVENFRSLENATFNFQPGLNVLIGANNAAKTAVVDALRIVFSLGTFEKKEDLIRLRPTDVFSDGVNLPDTVAITFTATFYGKTDSDLPAQFYEMLCLDESVQLGENRVDYTVFRLMYRADFEYSNSKGRYESVRTGLKGGTSLSNPISLEVLDSMRAVYLAPLRDLVNDRARVGAEIERLILSHTPKDREDARKEIPGQLKERAIELIKAVTDDKHHVAAGNNLAQYAKPYQIGEGSLSFTPSGISDGLFSAMLPVFDHSLHGLGKLPLSSNGLGINQLIYASIVLSRRGEAEVDNHVRKFFLIEEPEAHLHPQLQDSFFHALNQITDHQIFVTSHSPTITAKIDLEKIIVMRRDAVGRTAHPLHLAEAFKDRDDDKKYLHKFLDVTRSQLLFAKGAIFVEGITEAMLMQRFSEILGISLRDAAIEVVVIDSSHGFDHFRPLFDNGDDAYCRAVFITDGDESAQDVASDQQLKGDSESHLDQGLDTEGTTRTATGYGTFEFGLLRSSVINGGNEEMQSLLASAMEASAPEPVKNSGSQAEFVQDFLNFDRPALSYKKMKERTKNTCVCDSEWYGTWHTNSYFKAAKSDFAFYLNEALADLDLDQARERFVVPKYIRDAIEFVVGDLKASED